MVRETTTERRHGGDALLSYDQEPIISKALDSSNYRYINQYAYYLQPPAQAPS